MSASGIAPRSEVLVPSWAADVAEGDTIAFETPKGVLEAEVIGFSEVEEFAGWPVVEMPDELTEHFPAKDVLVIREQDRVTADEEAITGP